MNMEMCGKVVRSVIVYAEGVFEFRIDPVVWSLMRSTCGAFVDNCKATGSI